MSDKETPEEEAAANAAAGIPEVRADLPQWYAELQERAAQVNHQLRVVAIPGPPVYPGLELTVKPIEADAMTLPGSLDWIETYLASDVAAKRGDLYRARTETRQAYLDALVAQQDARRAWKDAVRAVEDDTNEATDTVEVDVDDPAFPLGSDAETGEMPEA